MSYRIFLLWLLICLTVAMVSRNERQKKLNRLTHEALVAMAQAEQGPQPKGLYQDSLNVYFGQLEQDLIRQYKINFESLKTDSEFDNFFTNALTLRTTLTQSLQGYAESHPEITKMFALPWLEELMPGFRVRIVDEGRKWVMQPDYGTYLQRAALTKGNTDEEYFKLMLSCYEPSTQFPTWLKKVETAHSKFCTRLGEGTHLSIFRQLHKVDSAGNSFDNQIRKIRQMVMSDLLFAKQYCQPADKALEEIRTISKEFTFEAKEKDLLQKRIVALEAFE